MADFIIIIRPEPDASRDVAWFKRYQVPAIAVPVMQVEKRPFARGMTDTTPIMKNVVGG